MIVNLIVRGTIHTGDPDRPGVDQSAVLGGRVVAVGTDCAGLVASGLHPVLHGGRFTHRTDDV